MWEVDSETRSKLYQIQKREGSGNDKCCDCGAPSPQWASPKFSIFICLTCAGTHRSLGVHISFVRSISMDAFKHHETLRMQHGGNKAWQDFYNQNSGVTFEESTIKERYDNEVGEEWKERLTAKIEGKEFDKVAFTSERAAILQTQAGRSQTPVGGPKKIAAGISGGPRCRSESPAPSLPYAQKVKNEAYFAKMGQANATRSADLPPNQGGKYAGFGSAGPELEKQERGIPSADEFQKDPVAALTKGFGWVGAALGKRAKVVNESYIQPTAKNIASSDFAAQARTVAAQAGSTIQSGAKNAADSLNKFVEGKDERAGAGGTARAEPERKDFWESFGAAAAGAGDEGPSSVGTSAMKNGGGSKPAPGIKGRNDGWEEW